jgi:hypothetical protein
MVIRALIDLSGVGRDGRSYQLSINEVKDVEDYIACDLIKHGMAVPGLKGIAITPEISRDRVIHAVIKRRKRV